MTDHVKDQLCARIEELEKEKLELNEQLDMAQQERDEAARDLAMEQEHHQATRRSEEALAAHVESARPMVEAYRSQIGGALWALDGEELVFAEAAEEWLVASPKTSLARLKAQWQAEALDKLADEGNWSCEAIRWEADELRQQAEGGET